MNPAAPLAERRRAIQPPPSPKVETAAAATADTTPDPAARALARTLPDRAAPFEEIELSGGNPLAMTPEAEKWVAAQKHGGDVPVRLGSYAHGTLKVHQTDAGIDTVGGHQTLSLAGHPTLGGLTNAGVEPVLRVGTQRGRLQGHLGLRVGRSVFDTKPQLKQQLETASHALGLSGLGGLSLPIETNELLGPTLVVRSGPVRFGVRRFYSATGTFGIQGAAMTFEAEARATVNGLAEVVVPIKRAADGSLTGSLTVAISYKNFAGQLTAAFGHGVLDIHGNARYHTEKMTGDVTVVVTDVANAKALTASRLPEEVLSTGQSLITPAVASDGAAPKPGPRVVAGWGTLDVVLASWLTGNALVVVEPTGDVTVKGKITPRLNKPLVPQQPEKSITLVSLHPEISYGLPVIGDIGIGVNLELAAFAVLGPVTLADMSLEGDWSTDPEKLKKVVLTGTLNASAVAGLRLTAEAEAHLRILRHTVSVGVGMHATAGIKGYLEATPRIGYRELADPALGKHGEFFIGGHLEIAAQPFLGLEGYFYVDLDSPWWSPAPSKRWPWPIGSLEYPLPGQFGIGADVEHVLGSDEVPEIKFTEVAFDAHKFMTDLVAENVPAKRGRDTRTPGSWRPAPQPAGTLPMAEPSHAGKSVGPTPSIPAKPAPAARMARNVTPPTTPDRAANGRAKPDPGLEKRWHAALDDLRLVVEHARTNPLDHEEMAAVLADLKSHHRFTELSAHRSGDEWLLDAAMNPKAKVKPKADPKDPATTPTAAKTEPESSSEPVDGDVTFEFREADRGLPLKAFASGRAYEQALAKFLNTEVAAEIAGGREVQVTTPASPTLDQPASSTHRLPSTLVVVRFRQQRGISVDGLTRRPDALADVAEKNPETGLREVTEVHIVEATLDAGFRFKTKRGDPHKKVQVSGTLWALSRRYGQNPNVRFVYRFFAPAEMPKSTRDFLEGEIRKQGLKNVSIIWTKAR
jgi:hypothetical protein